MHHSKRRLGETGFDPLFPRAAHRAYWKAQYLGELSDGYVDLVAERVQDRPAPMTMINTFLMGGAIADVDLEDTAFATREAPGMVSIDGLWTEDQAGDEEVVGWVRSTFEAVTEFGTGDVYLNFTGLAAEDVGANVDSAFGRNLGSPRSSPSTTPTTSSGRTTTSRPRSR